MKEADFNLQIALPRLGAGPVRRSSRLLPNLSRRISNQVEQPKEQGEILNGIFYIGLWCKFGVDHSEIGSRI